MKTRLSVLVIFFSIVVFFAIGLVFHYVDKQLYLDEKVLLVMDIYDSSSNLNSELNLFRLELWKYVLDPNKERMFDLESARTRLNNFMDSFSNLIHTNNAQVYSGGVEVIENAMYDSENFNASVDVIIAKGKLYEEAQTSEEKELIKQEIKESLLSSEIEFNDLGISNRIEEFSVKQYNLAQEMASEISGIISLIEVFTIVLAGLYLCLFVIIDICLIKIRRFLYKRNKISF